MKKANFLSFVFVLLVVLASSYVDYEYYNFFKFSVLFFSVFIILSFKTYINFKFDRNIALYTAYVFFLCFHINEFDEFSYRIVFNSIVIIFSAYAMLSLTFYRRHLFKLSFLVFAFFVYAYFFRVNHYDFKPQVHSQIFTLLVMLVLLNFYKEKFRYAFLTLTLVVLSNVRSVLIGLAPILPLMTKRIKPGIFDIYMISTISLSTFVFFYLFNNLEDLMAVFGDSANSFSWRLYHWNNIFKDFEFRDWIFGKGLGFSWRTTLFIEDFYTDGSTYVAAHSNYVKIIADTGILGLGAFITTIFLIYIKSSKLIKFLIIFYLSYGFYDEGVWFFSLFWLVILTYDRMKESDFDINYDQR